VIKPQNCLKNFALFMATDYISDRLLIGHFLFLFMINRYPWSQRGYSLSLALCKRRLDRLTPMPRPPMIKPTVLYESFLIINKAFFNPLKMSAQAKIIQFVNKPRPISFHDHSRTST
jgi:hypothetical protein